MHKASSRIWTCITKSICNDNNSYITSVSNQDVKKKKWIKSKERERESERRKTGVMPRNKWLLPIALSLPSDDKS